MSFQLTPEITQKIAMWFATGRVGVSSRTIASIAVGAQVGDWDVPHDSDDFSRCYALLKAVPELRQALPLVAEKCPKWGPLVEVWDELTELYEKDEAEEPIYETVKQGRGKRPIRRLTNKRSCHDRIRGLYDACMIAGGWVQKSQGWWVRENGGGA